MSLRCIDWFEDLVLDNRANRHHSMQKGQHIREMNGHLYGTADEDVTPEEQDKALTTQRTKLKRLDDENEPEYVTVSQDGEDFGNIKESHAASNVFHGMNLWEEQLREPNTESLAVNIISSTVINANQGCQLIMLPFPKPYSDTPHYPNVFTEVIEDLEYKRSGHAVCNFKNYEKPLVVLKGITCVPISNRREDGAVDESGKEESITTHKKRREMRSKFGKIIVLIKAKIQRL